MNKVRTVIIGGGPSGLGVAHWLKAHDDEDFIILEGKNEVGGLCASINEGGAIFDIGGHSFHTPHKHVKDLVDSVTKMEYQKRDARVWFHGDEIQYPFQQHYKDLSDQEVIDACDRSLKEPRPPLENALNFYEYLIWKFGSGVANNFMLPYNEKLWARNLHTMSTEWTGQRIADVDRKAFGHTGERTALQDDTLVGYPANGGFQQIFTAMAEALTTEQLKFQSRVVRVYPDEKIVYYTEKGISKTVHYDRLITTAPLNFFVGTMLFEAESSIKAEAEKLEYLSLSMLMLAYDDTTLDSRVPQRLYIGDKEIPAHKVAFNSTSSHYLMERPVRAIMCEMSYSDMKALPRNADQTMIAFLQENGYANVEKLVHQEITNIRMAYPVYTPERPEALTNIKAYLRKLGIFSIGRFGSWEYINSDKCLDEAFRLVETELL